MSYFELDCEADSNLIQTVNFPENTKEIFQDYNFIENLFKLSVNLLQ